MSAPTLAPFDLGPLRVVIAGVSNAASNVASIFLQDADSGLPLDITTLNLDHAAGLVINGHAVTSMFLPSLHGTYIQPTMAGNFTSDDPWSVTREDWITINGRVTVFPLPQSGNVE